MSNRLKGQCEYLRLQNALEKNHVNKSISFMVIYLHVSVSPNSPPEGLGMQAPVPRQWVWEQTLHFCMSMDTAGLEMVTTPRTAGVPVTLTGRLVSGPGSCRVL